MSGDRSKWKLVLKCAWITAVVCIWFLGLGSCMTEPSCFFAQNNLFPFIILLSFPGGLLLFLFVGPFIDFYPSIDYSLLCLGALAVGYIQWFHAIPRLLGKHEITLLCLSEREKPDARENELCAHPAKLRSSRTVHHDKNGRTPLERALNEKRSRLTNAFGKTSQSSRRPTPSMASLPNCSDRRAAIPHPRPAPASLLRQSPAGSGQAEKSDHNAPR